MQDSMEEERMAVVRGGEGGIVEISSEVSGLRIVGAVKVDQGIFFFIRIQQILLQILRQITQQLRYNVHAIVGAGEG